MSIETLRILTQGISSIFSVFKIGAQARCLEVEALTIKDRRKRNRYFRKAKRLRASIQRSLLPSSDIARQRWQHTSTSSRPRH